jgi:hypothetical protein
MPPPRGHCQLYPSRTLTTESHGVPLWDVKLLSGVYEEREQEMLMKMMTAMMTTMIMTTMTPTMLTKIDDDDIDDDDDDAGNGEEDSRATITGVFTQPNTISIR